MKKALLKLPENPKRVTYFDNRKCHYCGEPIADQERKNRIHCPESIDENGKIINCKRKKFDVKHQPETEILKDHNARAKDYHKKIKKMRADQGEFVTSAIIDSYGICLTESDNFHFDGHQLTSYFIGFAIISNPITNMHRIIELN